MDVSVVIPVRDGAAVIGEQLAALAEQRTELAWEVVVADNGSTDLTRAVVEAWRDRLGVPLSIADASAIPGIGHARNTGVAAARGDAVAFCDSDDRVAPGWVQAAWSATRQCDLVGGLNRRLTDPQDPAAEVLNPGCLKGIRYRAVVGCNFAVTRDAFLAVGGFDESLPPYGCDDVEFSMRVADAGFSVGAAPEMVVYFRETTGLRRLLRKVYLSGKAEAVVWRRHSLDYPEIPPTVGAAWRRLLTFPVAGARALVSGETPKAVIRDGLQRAGNLAALRELARRPLAPPRLLGAVAQPRTALWVIPVSDLAGVARHTIDVARVGIPGWRIVVAAPEGPLLGRLRSIGAEVVAADIGPGVATVSAVRRLRRVIADVGPDVAHSHLARADILLALAATGSPLPLVSTEHHISPDPMMFHRSRPGALAMRCVHHLRTHRFAALLAVSDSTRRDMIRYWRPSRPVRVVRNGVDRPAAPSSGQPGLRLLTLCRLSPEKNLSQALRAFAIVRREHPEASLTVAGTGPQATELVELAQAMGLDVDFPGFVDAAVAMSNHDVIVQPSRSDNLSYTLLDAVAHGMGVAASSIGGNPEILPGRCIADDDAGLARVIVEQGLNPELRPAVPAHIPTVRGMAAEIAEVYAAAVTLR